MPNRPKPSTAAAYTEQGYTDHVRQTSLYLATKLGDFNDELVIVGGMTPTLIVDQAARPNFLPHCGTLDLDLGFAISILNHKRYAEIENRLREAGFAPDVAEDGKTLVHQRWIDKENRVTVDFLIESTGRPGTLQHLNTNFAAINTPGLHLAFHDRISVTLDGRTSANEQAARTVWVCGPGAFVVLKALAFRLRGTNKDAYDLHYVVRHFGTGIDDVANHLKPLMTDPTAQQAINYLKADFATPDSTGPSRVAEFLGDRNNDDLKADVVGDVRELLRLIAQ